MLRASSGITTGSGATSSRTIRYALPVPSSSSRRIGELMVTTMTEPTTCGLHDVIAADTVLSRSDAQRAQLWLRGQPLGQAVHELGYDGTVALLGEGFAGRVLTREGIRASLGAARKRAFDRL